MPTTWHLKLLGYDDAREDDRLFGNLKTLLEGAPSFRAARPGLRLVVTVPTDVLKAPGFVR